MEFIWLQDPAVCRVYSLPRPRVLCEACRVGGERAETRRIVNMMFTEFCETTGLHGWKYLTRVRVETVKDKKTFYKTFPVKRQESFMF